MRTIKVGTACCGLAMLVAGCGGGGGRLSSDGYARRATSICVRANRAIARVEIPRFGDDAATAHAVARIVVIQRASIDDLRELRPPEHLGSLNQRWIALLDQGTDELELMGVTLADGHRTRAGTYGGHATTLLDRARVLVAARGVTSCRGPAPPLT